MGGESGRRSTTIGVVSLVIAVAIVIAAYTSQRSAQRHGSGTDVASVQLAPASPLPGVGEGRRACPAEASLRRRKRERTRGEGDPLGNSPAHSASKTLKANTNHTNKDEKVYPSFDYGKLPPVRPYSHP